MQALHPNRRPKTLGISSRVQLLARSAKVLALRAAEVERRSAQLLAEARRAL